MQLNWELKDGKEVPWQHGGQGGGENVCRAAVMGESLGPQSWKSASTAGDPRVGVGRPRVGQW